MAVPVGQRNIPNTVENKFLIAGERARYLAVHTIRICSNKNIFLEQYQGALTEDLIATAKDIFIKTMSANDVRVNSEADWEKRSALQREAVLLCERMKRLIGIARELFHLRKGKTAFWVGLVEETLSLLRNWHDKDRERYRSRLNKGT